VLEDDAKILNLLQRLIIIISSSHHPHRKSKIIDPAPTAVRHSWERRRLAPALLPVVDFFFSGAVLCSFVKLIVSELSSSNSFGCVLD
jgi:hypothetical protein